MIQKTYKPLTIKQVQK